jgi:RNA polymerase sigma factor (sigma-70 family)
MAEDVRPVLLDFLSQRYGDLKRKLTHMLGSDDIAGDALHDTWLQLRRLEEHSAPILNPRAYLLRMAVNLALNNLRSQVRAVPLSEIDALLEVADPTPGPEQTVAGRREMEALSEIIMRMPQRRQDILMMVRWEGLPQKEVAERLGISLSTVEQELKRAHDFCVACMDDKK